MSEVVCRVTRQMLAGNGTFITLSGAKYQERSAGKTLSVVTGHGVIITALPLEALGPDMGSCVRIDLNHLSMHEHSRRRGAEKVSKKNESQRCVKGEIDELLMFVIILRLRNIFISLFPPLCVGGPGRWLMD